MMMTDTEERDFVNSVHEALDAIQKQLAASSGTANGALSDAVTKISTIAQRLNGVNLGGRSGTGITGSR